MTKAEFLRLIKACLARRYPKAAIRAQCGDGGWVVEIVHPRFGADPHAETKDAFRLLDSALAGQREFVWHLCTAENELDRFSDHATLRTNPTRYVNGVRTSILMAGDCYLDITEFDAEVLNYSEKPEWNRSVEGIETRSESGEPLLSFKPTSKYLTVEIGGTAHALEKQPEVRSNATPRRVLSRFRHRTNHGA